MRALIDGRLPSKTMDMGFSSMLRMYRSSSFFSDISWNLSAERVKKIGQFQSRILKIQFRSSYLWSHSSPCTHPRNGWVFHWRSLEVNAFYRRNIPPRISALAAWWWELVEPIPPNKQKIFKTWRVVRVANKMQTANANVWWKETKIQNTKTKEENHSWLTRRRVRTTTTPKKM